MRRAGTPETLAAQRELSARGSAPGPLPSKRTTTMLRTIAAPRHTSPFPFLLLLALLLPLGAAAVDDFTSSFRLGDCRFLSRGANPYFILDPERQLVYEGDDTELIVTVLERTRSIRLPIAGRMRTVETAVVEEREFEDGEIVEVSRNFFAICEKTGDVFYFGEQVDIYENGVIVSHEGQWQAGRAGAKPGIIMPGTFLLGSRYFQEVAPGVALDRAEHTAEGLEVATGAGDLHGCVEVTETSPLDPGSESTKVYCPGVGLAVDNDLVLVEISEDDD